MSISDKQKERIEKFQCPGCVHGGDTNCGMFSESIDAFCNSCQNHVLGTHIGFNILVALGLPKGFNRPGRVWDDKAKNFIHESRINIRLLDINDLPEWNKLNIPVWAMEKDGYLFVRTVMPRIGMILIDVIEGGTLDLVPNALNVAEFIDEID